MHLSGLSITDVRRTVFSSLPSLQSLLPPAGSRPAAMVAPFEFLTHPRRDPAVSSASPSFSSSLRTWIMVYNILSGLGLISLAVIFLTALLSPTVRRVSTWYGYMIAWMAMCIPPFLVIGHQAPGQEPSPAFAPCALDAALMYASRPFAAFGTLSLLSQLYLHVSTRLKRGQIRPEFVFVFLSIPPILYLLMFLWTFILGIANPDLVELEPGGFYCHINIISPAIVGACLVVFATSAALVIEALIVILLCRNWRAFRSLQRCDRDGNAVSLNIIIRISVFAIMPVIGLILSFLTYNAALVDDIWLPYNLLIASMPAGAALIFGSQTDIVRVWMFWRKPKSDGKTELSLTTVDSNASIVEL
ncbi:hypothetical protein MSAN_00955000 [Mycena sanguinolenta]|uniref:Uncharacterized protein n=1 Tax=Mycena sanguinolenta TaxID=230812 RepID=A0A8H6YTM7_9AGAR|nr:hypothetical protein MSAN_00955000 [Mycena sanguinolenta]